jgi:putative zinc finger protein
MSDDHASARLISGYAEGAKLPDDQVWALEAHLESCAVCRARLAEAVPAPVPSLVAGVWSELTPELAGQAPARRRLVSRLVPWATPVMLPWFVMVVLVAATAVLLDRMVTLDGEVSFLQLFAPVLPVLGVAAAWAPGLDPAHELSAASPRAGLHLVLRRTTAVLVVVVPLLTVAGWLTGTTIVLSLLPCLAFTTGTLALGGLIGVRRAALGLLLAWAVALLPAVVNQPVLVLHSGSVPVWIVLLTLTTATVVLRRNAFTTLTTEN